MVLSMERFKGKVAVVTGASSGIGAAIATLLVQNGLKVIGIARRSDRIEQRAKELSNQPGQLLALQTDLSKEIEILDAFKWIELNAEPIHILINNAGISLNNTLIDGDCEKWRQVLDINVIALSLCTREAIKSMKKHKISGHIVHMNSILGHKVVAFPGLNIYPGAKHAVTALTETLRQDLGRERSKIKISSISPGLVESEMTTLSETLPKEKLQALANMPVLKPEDIADAVVYVLSTPSHVQVHELLIKPVGEIF